jgi:hypothetical protein
VVLCSRLLRDRVQGETVGCLSLLEWFHPLCSLQLLTNVSKQTGNQKVADNLTCKFLKAGVRYCFGCLLADGIHNGLRILTFPRSVGANLRTALRISLGLKLRMDLSVLVSFLVDGSVSPG